jgi:phosphoribosylaminoimidazole-succinocarboxamide synthase
METHLVGRDARRGKVRDVFDLGDGRLLIVATDRISAFDWVLPTGVPDKGRVLAGISAFWFEHLGVPNHLISTEVGDSGIDLPPDVKAALAGRSMVVRKARVVPFECVVRGYLAGSGWKEYRASDTVCGERLPSGLIESDRLPAPIFTPATKAESGHDENVPFEAMAQAVGSSLAGRLRELSIGLYRKAAAHAEQRGLLLADTKFEFGTDPEGEVLLIDEALTPDSSRYWPADRYRPGGPQPSYDKQYVRDWLETTGWDKASPPPALPDEVVARTREKYVQAYELLTGASFPWK